VISQKPRDPCLEKVFSCHFFHTESGKEAKGPFGSFEDFLKVFYIKNFLSVFSPGVICHTFSLYYYYYKQGGLRGNEGCHLFSEENEG
jgi:hypothetical protein